MENKKNCFIFQFTERKFEKTMLVTTMNGIKACNVATNDNKILILTNGGAHHSPSK